MQRRAILSGLILFAIPMAFAAGHSVASANEKIELTTNGSSPSVNVPTEYFTGQARLEPLAPVRNETPFSASAVTFEPGARSNWHTHPLGQTLIVTAGTGWVQEDGASKKTIRPGDVVWIPAGVKHWHGATSSNAMTHIAIQGMDQGRNVTWMERVSDADYLD